MRIGGLRLPTAMAMMGGGERTVTLPQYLLTNQGETWGDFNDADDWTQGIAGASIATNTTPGEFRYGTASITMTTGVGTNCQMYRDYTARVFASAKPRRKLYVYCYSEDIANIQEIRLLIGKSNYSNYTEKSFSSVDYRFRVGWNCLEGYPTQTEVTTDATTGYQRVRITLIPKAGTQCHISVDQLVVDHVGVPCMMWTFDDGHLNVYTEGYQYLKTKRGRATFYIDTSLVNSGPTYVTTATLQEMGAYGWAMANHFDSNTNMTTLTQEQVETGLTNAKNALEGWGLTKASRHVAYPQGGWNETVQAAMLASGMLSGRHTLAGGLACPLDAYADNIWVYPITKYIDNTVSLATMQTLIDNAVINGQVCIFVAHQIGHHLGLPLDITTEDFQAIVDYAVSKNMPFINVADMYDSLSGPVTVPMPG